MLECRKTVKNIPHGIQNPKSSSEVINCRHFTLLHFGIGSLFMLITESSRLADRSRSRQG
jgi:hypothetical protein